MLVFIYDRVFYAGPNWSVPHYVVDQAGFKLPEITLPLST